MDGAEEIMIKELVDTLISGILCIFVMEGA